MTEQRKRIALISVSDTAGLQDLATGLRKHGVCILSTGETAGALHDFGIEFEEVGSYTGFPEMMGGRVKTLHPKVHGGILYLRGDAAHKAAAKENGIVPIDFVVVNLYPFWRMAERRDVALSRVVEEIDIGGSALLRAAAKNYESVTVLSNPRQYLPVLKLLGKGGRTVPRNVRARLALEAFKHTADYDRQISDWFATQLLFPPLDQLSLEQLKQLPRGQFEFAVACGENLSTQAEEQLIKGAAAREQ
ncbi:MAG TPA: hypothetical protein VJJ55_02870 [Candidatus Paceibacterota bacterium]